MCTATADDLADLDLNCVGDYLSTNWTACEDWHGDGLTWQCAYSSCFPGTVGQVDSALALWVGRRDFYRANYSFITLTTPYDGTSIMLLAARFVSDNAATTTFPSCLGITPRPRYLNQRDTFDEEAYLNGTNFQTTGRELVRQQATALLNANSMDYGFMDLGNSAMITTIFESLVYTPLRCSTLPLASIPWLANNTISVSRFVYSISYFVGLDMSTSIAEPDTWAAVCADTIGVNLPEFCDQFPSYYAYESLRDFSLVPSPWVDVTYMLRAYNEEFRACGEPVGCIGFPS